MTGNKSLKDVRLLIKAAAAELGIAASAENHEITEGETEYIVYFIEGEKNDLFADNKPHLRRSDAALYYVTLHANNKLTRPDEIIGAMERQGFRVTERQIDLVNPYRVSNLLETG
jgi:hypothetical protein